MANFDPNSIEIPELIAIKFETGNYVRKTSTKFGANPTTGVLLGK